jgi:hypothetical protein
MKSNRITHHRGLNGNTYYSVETEIETLRAAAGLGGAGIALDSGAAIDWATGDVTITHAANALAFAGGSAGYTFDAGTSVAATSAIFEADPTSGYFGSFEAYAANEYILTQSEVQAADESGGWRTALALYHNDSDNTNYESLPYRTISDGLRVGVFGKNDGAGTYSAVYKDLHGVTAQVIGRVDWVDRGVAAFAGDSIQMGAGVCLNELTMSNPSAGNAQSSQIAGWYITLSGKKAAADASHTNHGVFVNNHGKLATAGVELYSGGTDGDNGQYAYGLRMDQATVSTYAIAMPASAATDVGCRIFYETGSWSSYDRTGNAFTWALGSANVIALDGSTFFPAADGGASLGYTTLAWQNLYLNTGGTINFENGDVIITHASNQLTMSGGALIVSTGSTTPASLGSNGQFTLTPTGDTNFRISYRGSDGVTRVGNITLA